MCRLRGFWLLILAQHLTPMCLLNYTINSRYKESISSCATGFQIFLLEMMQVVKTHSPVTLNTGVGRVVYILTTLLFSLYTNDCTSCFGSLHILSRSSDESACRAEEGAVVEWWRANNLPKMIIDFWIFKIIFFFACGLATQPLLKELERVTCTASKIIGPIPLALRDWAVVTWHLTLIWLLHLMF